MQRPHSVLLHQLKLTTLVTSHYHVLHLSLHGGLDLDYSHPVLGLSQTDLQL